MARVAVAYVEVRPDTTKFGDLLKEKLKAFSDIAVNVKVQPDVAAARSAAQATQRAASKASNDIERELAAKRRAAAAADARHAAEDYAKAWASTWDAKMGHLVTEEARDIERAMARKFGNIGATIARATVRAFNRDVDKAMKEAGEKGASQFLRRFSGRFQGGGIATTLRFAMRGVASVMQTTGDLAANAFTGLTNVMSKMGGPIGSIAERMVKFGGGAESAAASVGSLAAGIAGGAAAAALLATALVALNVVLGAILAVVIPLVAGITALVAQMTALAGVAVGSIGLLPGLFAAAAAAFGPLLLVGDRFEKLFEDTAKHTGPLFVALERLKNAIWSVLGVPFVAEIQKFVSGPLTQMLGGIEAVSRAWGQLLTGLVRLASSAPMIGLFNTLLDQGAGIVRWLHEQILTLAPALVSLVTAAGPPLGMILDAVSGIVREFAGWISQMAASGELQAFFNQLALIMTQLGGLVGPLASVMGGWIAGMIGPVTQFVGLLGQMVGRWAELANSAAGQQMISTFFLSMNRVVAAFEPILEQVVTLFLQMGPTIAGLMDAAGPALQALISTFSTLVTAIAPAVEAFLSNFRAMLEDPLVQEAITRLAEGIGELLGHLTASPGLMEAVVNVMANFTQQAIPLADVLMALMDILVPLLGLITSVMMPAFEVLAAILKPVVALFRFFGEGLNEAAGYVRTFVDWIKETFKPLQWLDEKLGWLGKHLGNTGQSAEDAAKKFGGASNDMVSSLNGVANAKAWTAIGNNADAVGDYLINMANNGIRGNNALIQSMAAMGAAAYAAKNEVDIATFEKNVGRAYTRPSANLYRDTVAGTKAGTAFMNAYGATVSTKAGDAASKATEAVKAALDDLNAFVIIKGRTLYDSSKEIADYIAKGLTSGAKNIAKVSAMIQKSYPGTLRSIISQSKTFWAKAASLGNKVLPDFANQMKRFTSGEQLDAYLASRKDLYTQLLTQIKTFKSNVVDALSGGRTMVGLFGFIPTPAEVQAQLNQQLAKMRDFTRKLAQLQAKGLNKELAAAWLQAGYDSAGNLVEGLSSATSADIAKINATYTQIGNEAAKTADAQATKYFGLGESTVKGYVDGIASMQNIANKTMQTLIDNVYKAAKKKLDAHSPSKLFATVGVDTVAGYIEGINQMTDSALTTVADLYGQVGAVPAAQLAAPAGYVPNTGLGVPAPPPQPPQINLRVYLGERDITDIVRVVVDGYDTANARDLLAGRRGG